jgi:predicted N-acetyltransferase YhbS
MAKAERSTSAAFDGPRLVRREEREDLEDLMAVSFGFARRPRPAQRRRRRQMPGASWVISHGGKPVSHIRVVYNDILVYGCRVKVASIGGVCTHPEYRGQGIATILLEHCTREAAAAGARLLLISGQRGLYRRAQAVKAGAMLRANLAAGSTRWRSSGLAVRPAEGEDWAACARLYQLEPVRFLRPAGVFAQAFGGRWHGEKWVVESGGEVRAYVVLRREWGSPPGDPRRMVAEYAGSRVALVGALPRLFAAGSLREIEFEFPSYDRDLVHLFSARGVELGPASIRDHTVRLLNLTGLMRALRPYAAARLTPGELRRLSVRHDGERCIFSFEGEEIALGLGQSAALVLGGPKPPKASGELGRVLGALFPVPLPMPGLNYT